MVCRPAIGFLHPLTSQPFFFCTVAKNSHAVFFCLPSGRPSDQSGNPGQVRPFCRQPGDRLRRSSDSARRVLAVRASKKTLFIFLYHLTSPPTALLPPAGGASCCSLHQLHNLFLFYFFSFLIVFDHTHASLLKFVLGQCRPWLCAYRVSKKKKQQHITKRLLLFPHVVLTPSSSVEGLCLRPF